MLRPWRKCVELLRVPSVKIAWFPREKLQSISISSFISIDTRRILKCEIFPFRTILWWRYRWKFIWIKRLKLFTRRTVSVNIFLSVFIYYLFLSHKIFVLEEIFRNTVHWKEISQDGTEVLRYDRLSPLQTLRWQSWHHA